MLNMRLLLFSLFALFCLPSCVMVFGVSPREAANEAYALTDISTAFSDFDDYQVKPSESGLVTVKFRKAAFPDCDRLALVWAGQYQGFVPLGEVLFLPAQPSQQLEMTTDCYAKGKKLGKVSKYTVTIPPASEIGKAKK